MGVKERNCVPIHNPRFHTKSLRLARIDTALAQSFCPAKPAHRTTTGANICVSPANLSQASWNVREIGFCGYYSLLVHSFKRGGGQNFEHFPRQPRPHIYELVCIAQPQNAARNSVRIHHHARETRSQAGPREGGTDMVARWLEPDY